MASEQDRTPIVWIVNEGGHNYKPAEKLGRLLVITKDNINPFNVGRLMVTVGHRLRHASEDDYVLISGLPILNAVVLAMWLSRFPSCNVLLWSTTKESYEIRRIDRETIDRLANDTATLAD